MSNEEYVCSNCGDFTEREMLTVKKVSFQEIGLNPTTLRARTVAWLCPKCVAIDPDWRQEAYQGGRKRVQPGRSKQERLGRIASYREIERIVNDETAAENANQAY